MMDKDMKRVSQIAQEGPRGLIRIVDFTLATIQQQFPTIPNILRDWEVNGSESPSMFASKRDGWLYIRQHDRRLYSLMRYAHRNGDVEEAIDTMLEVPGLGIVKAAFVCQLFGFNTGCIDTHNADLYDIDVNAFRTTPTMTARTKLAKISAYQALVIGLGGSQPMWERWCEFVAERYDSFASAYHVSRHHVYCVGGDYQYANSRLEAARGE